MTSPSEQRPSKEQLADQVDCISRDCFERLVRELVDVVPEPRWTAGAVLELIRAEIARINTTGKLVP